MQDKDKSTRPFDAQDDRELFDEMFSVASASECTGMIPAMPPSGSEIDSYSEIYDIPLSKESIREEGLLDDCGSTDSAPGRKAKH